MDGITTMNATEMYTREEPCPFCGKVVTKTTQGGMNYSSSHDCPTMKAVAVSTADFDITTGQFTRPLQEKE